MVFCIFYLYTEDEGNIVAVLIDLASNLDKCREIIQDHVKDINKLGSNFKTLGHTSMNVDNNYTFIGKREDITPFGGPYGSRNGYLIEDIEIKS